MSKQYVKRKPITPPAGLRVLLAIHTYAAYQREMIQGVLRFARVQTPRWEFELRKDLKPIASVVEQMRSDSIIAHVGLADRRGAEAVRAKKVPTVMMDDRSMEDVPTVSADNPAIGAMAFAHLRGKGFTRFAFVGWTKLDHFRDRREAFIAAVREARLELFHSPEVDCFRQELEHHPAFHLWMKRLVKPIGIFAGNADIARPVARLCRDQQVLVPEEVAVLGVDNEMLDCELQWPPLSTIDHAMERVGYEAAALLDRLIKGEPAPREPILVPPVGVIERQSTDTLAVEDPDVRAAMRFIRQRATSGATVKDLLNEMGVARRKIEITFRNNLGRTIHEELTRVRLERARALLRTTEMTLPQVATSSGFQYASGLGSLFSRVVGMTPMAYRRQQRGHYLPESAVSDEIRSSPVSSPFLAT
jgi:LacI family transcriptional regulator